MGHISFPAPPLFLVEAGQTVPGPSAGAETASSWTSGNWAGYAATASSNAYDYVVGTYNEPQALSTSCTGNKEVTWDGIGGVPENSPLAQIGTGIHLNNLQDHQAWWEVLPDSPQIVPLSIFAHPGYAVTVHVQYDFGGAYWFHIYDQYSGQSDDFVDSTSSYNGTRADFITERPTNPDQSLAPLTDFSYITWLDAEAEQSSGLNPLGSWPNDNFTMYNYNGGYDLAHPGPLYNGGKQFSVFYDTCN